MNATKQERAEGARGRVWEWVSPSHVNSQCRTIPQGNAKLPTFQRRIPTHLQKALGNVAPQLESAICVPDYVRGFGDVAGDHWLGLEKLYRLAKQSVRLRVDMKRLDDESLYAEYDFVLSDASELYRLRLANYRGNATDSLKTQNKMFFTTYDSDNDKFKNGNCAIARYGGWWYKRCSTANLNGRHWTESPDDQSGMRWNNDSIKTTDKRVQVKDSVMMIRPLK
ncbi:techylectin-5B-like [Diadema antillarum]|uniref:techylectin-5B-like n=1 Tax=Diadema antillarum TaxID=105358 RepID=UPI003A8B0CA7